MAIDQFNNLLTVATALSLAGWVGHHHLPTNIESSHENIQHLGQFQHIRQTDDSENPTVFQDSNVNLYDGHYLQNYPQNYPNSFLQNYPQDLIRASGDNFPNNIPESFPENSSENLSEDYSELKFIPNFTSIDEAPDLLSWEEAHRRGDVEYNSNYVLPVSTNEVDVFNDIANSEVGYESLEPVSPAASGFSSLCALNSPNLQDINDIDVEDLLNVNLLKELVAEEEIFDSHEKSVADSNPGKQGASTSHADSDHFARLLNELHSQLEESEVQPEHTTSNWNIQNPSTVGDSNIDDYLRSFVEEGDNYAMESEYVQDSASMSSTGTKMEHLRDVLSGLDFVPQLVTENSVSTSEKMIWDAVENNGKEDERETNFNSQSGAGSSLPHTLESVEQDLSISGHEESGVLQNVQPVKPVAEGSVDFQVFKHNPISYSEPNTEGTGGTQSSSSRSGPTSYQGTKRQDVISPDLQYTEDELVDMDIDKFNNIISKFDEVRQIILKDLRKKGKNKAAARNSRKRKLDVLDDLDIDVESLMRKKELLLQEQQLLMEETRLIRDKTSMLSDYILENLHDELGNPYSHSHALEYTVDGNVYLVPLK